MNPAKVPKVRKELLDMDYLDKLSPEEFIWMAQFMDEFVGANIRKHDNGRIKKGQIHNTKKLVKECYDANNKRNNDVHSVTKANGLLGNIESAVSTKDGWYITNPGLQEDAVIAELDKKRNQEKKD